MKTECSSTINQDNFQAVFVNTTDKPVRIERMGLFNYRYDESTRKTYVFELVKKYYPHPDAREFATIYVMDFIRVDFIYGTDNTIKYIVDAMNGVGNITEIPE